ncbi:hypothetical protein [Fulvivirga ligni]|uniref:hypothetical protein n=1 Tax=Fulvivirga ligni TaxID=2904246 RepID=UPI001F2450F2|nr:hypothetical protein [Fulvivirga ligni]UII23572.1 hypothetical protein LVD16_10070 [Fulvivirga ligni]
MKVGIIIILISITCGIVHSQGIPNDTVSYGIREETLRFNKFFRPFDSINDSLLVRIWVSGHWFSSKFVEFRLNKNSDICFRRGFIDYETDSIITLPFKSDSLDYIFNKLIENHVLTLPDEKNAEVTIQKNGKSWLMPYDGKERIIESQRGDLFIIEIYNVQDYRDYGYTAPVELYQAFKRNNYECKDYYFINNIANSIYEDLKIIDLVRAQIKLHKE